jgi:cytochrome c
MPARLFLLALMAFLLGACRTPYHRTPPELPDRLPRPSVLVFTKIAGFRHASIPDGVQAIERIGTERGWSVFHTHNGAVFQPELLERFDVVVWLNTTGDVLSEDQQDAFEAFVEAGGGYVGVHAAADTETDWPWYGELVGARFKAHPLIPNVRSAEVVVERHDHPATAMLPERWRRSDEWYGFRTNPRENPEITVLASLDETTYRAGRSAMGDHPIVWHRDVALGRSFYTALGHTRASYEEPFFLQHLTGAIAWAGRFEARYPGLGGGAP